MALSLKGTVQLGMTNDAVQTTIYFEDTTGDYNADNNTGGYGSPNSEIDDIASTKLELKAPGSDEYVTLSDWTYLPTDANPATIVCSQYTPLGEEEEEEEEDCNDCPDDELLTDCEEEEATCFVDGCWTFRYTVYNVSHTILATTTFTEFFYGQTYRRIHDLSKLRFSNALPIIPNFDWAYQLNLLSNDFRNLLINAGLDSCDCSCTTNALASIQKRLTQFENLI